MSTNTLRAARLAASAALICLLFANASAFAAAAAAGAAGGAAAGAAGSAGGNGGPPVKTEAVVLPNDNDHPHYWHRRDSQKARDACPLQFPWCLQDQLD